MLGKRSILIFLLSVNIFAQISLTDELNDLREASSSVELSDWTALSPKLKKKVLLEDSIGRTSSALKKPLTQEITDKSEPPAEELNTIRYRSR